MHHLSDAVDALNRPAGWKPKRAPSRLIHQFNPMYQIERRIVSYLWKEPYRLTKRHLQQKMLRSPAKFFNRTLARLIPDDAITEYRGYFFPYSRAIFAEVVQPGIEARELNNWQVTQSG